VTDDAMIVPAEHQQSDRLVSRTPCLRLQAHGAYIPKHRPARIAGHPAGNRGPGPGVVGMRQLSPQRHVSSRQHVSPEHTSAPNNTSAVSGSSTTAFCGIWRETRATLSQMNAILGNGTFHMSTPASALLPTMQAINGIFGRLDQVAPAAVSADMSTLSASGTRSWPTSSTEPPSARSRRTSMRTHRRRPPPSGPQCTVFRTI